MLESDLIEELNAPCGCIAYAGTHWAHSLRLRDCNVCLIKWIEKFLSGRNK